MIAAVAATLAVVAAYLSGSIPFGFLIALWFRGVDIRAVGSGNIGATNVGRTLGFRFFVLVFALDVLKGFLPTYAFPMAAASVAGRPIPELGVLVALGAILGHNFPVYLGFRGGKGVATSLGALLALDPVASLSAAIGFVVFLAVTRYVSLSSMLGSLVFLAVYFSRVGDPWGRGHLAMSVATIGLVGLLFVRHRKNVVRIGAGTEPKVEFRRRSKPPAGKVCWVLLVTLAVVSLGAAYKLSVRAGRRTRLVVGGTTLTEAARVGTGHQRAERLAFSPDGTLLAVTCPRYDRLVIYRVTAGKRLELAHDLELEGHPMGVQATRGRFIVLERPAGDERHVRQGWWESFDFEGKPVGTRADAGMYPDDLAVTPDGRRLLIVTSGRGEGDSRKPFPALEVHDLVSTIPNLLGYVEFRGPGDDPYRITLSRSGRYAAVTLLGTNQIATVELGEQASPRLLGRSPLLEQEGSLPHLSVSGGDAILLGIAPERDALVFSWPAREAIESDALVCTRPRDSSLTLLDSGTRRLLGRFPLQAGALNLGAARPLGLAFAPGRALLAVATRSGSVHLIALEADERSLATLEKSGPLRPAAN